MKTILKGFVTTGLLLALVATAAAQQRYTAPILVGVDSSDAPRATTTTDLQFFRHPAGNPLFTDDGEIPLDGLFPIVIHDIIGSPGALMGGQVDARSERIEQLPGRTGSSMAPLNGIGPEDYSYSNGSGTQIAVGNNYQLAEGNQANRRLTIADIRAESPLGEFRQLFGNDPLEAGVLGDAQYTPGPAPATVVHRGFRWCLVPTAYPVYPFYQDCTDENPALTDPYDDVYLYDVADIGEGIVGAAYDAFNLNVLWEMGMTMGANQVAADAWMEQSGQHKASYVSPLTFFRMDDDVNPPRYRLTGYTAMEGFNLDTSSGNFREELTADAWQLLVTNPIIPMAVNPIAVEAIDIGGAGDRVGFPDTDVAVVYQNTLWGVNDYMLNELGRPAVFPYACENDQITESRAWRWADILGECRRVDSNDPTKCLDFESLADDSSIFPDEVMSLALFWKQEKQWRGGDYEHMNPSSFMEPEIPALVGPGMFDAAVLTDTVGNGMSGPTQRKQTLLVPSGGGLDANGMAIVYQVDPAGPHFWARSQVALFQVNPNMNQTGLSPIECVDPGFLETIIETPFVLPEPILILPPSGDYLPYQVRTGNLDGDACEDFIVTWRGRETVQLSEDAVHFSNGDPNEPRLFANHISIVLRSGDRCAEMEVRSLELPVDAALRPQVASAAIGDFDGDGDNDLAIGNMTAEEIVCSGNAATDAQNRCDRDGGNYTAFAYVVSNQGGATFTTAPGGYRRVRVGYQSYAASDLGDGLGAALVHGVGMIEADHVDGSPDALAQINGLPLMLPEIGCPDYTDDDDPTVASIYETYKSIAANIQASGLGSLPFTDAAGHPIPQRCADAEICKVTFNTHEYTLPLFVGDECCKPDCPTVQDDLSGGADPCFELLCTQLQAAELCYAWATQCALDLETDSWNTEDFEFNEMQHMEQMGPSGALDEGLLQREGEDRGEGDAGTEFAATWRPDVVISADRHAIGSMAAMVPAQTTEVITTKVTATNMTVAQPPSKTLLPITDLLVAAMAMQGRSVTEAELVEFQAVQNELNLALARTLERDPILANLSMQLARMVGFRFSLQNNSAEMKRAAGCQLGGDGTIPILSPSLDIENLRLPRGVDMPGDREMTAIALTGSVVCNYDGVQDSGEECDTATLQGMPAVELAQQQCPARPDQSVVGCEINTCTCLYDQPVCLQLPDDQVECKSDADCPAGRICDSQCSCRMAGEDVPGTGPGPDDPQILANVGPDQCECEVETYSSNAARDRILELNRTYIQDPSGRTEDQRIVEPGKEIVCVCRVEGGAAPTIPTADIGLSLSSSQSPLPDREGNVLPYMIAQTSGSQFLDIGRMEYNTVELVQQPLRVLPLEPTVGTQSASLRAMTLPDLSAGVDLALSQAVPMLAEVVPMEGGGTAINNMISFEVVPVAAGQSYSISSGIGAQQAPSTAPQAGSTVFIARYRVPLDVTPCPTCDGFNIPEGTSIEDWYIENRQFDLLQLKNVIASEGMQSNWPWERNLNYQFAIVQSVYGEAGEIPPDPKDIKLNFVAAPPNLAPAGGPSGCACMIASGSADLGVWLPIVLAMAVSTGGIAVGRFRRRRRR